jgi:hypothetical protein
MKRLFFSLHLFVTLLAWVAPFLFCWKWLVPAYGLVMLQFAVFGRCLMNEQHGLREAEGQIFYTELLETMGFRPDRQLVKHLVRRWLYPALAVLAVLWQCWWGKEPLLF